VKSYRQVKLLPDYYVKCLFAENKSLFLERMMMMNDVERQCTTNERERENERRMMIDDDGFSCVYSCPTVGEAAAVC